MQQQLAQRQQEASLRRLPGPIEAAADFASNDYLGLARSTALAAKIQQASLVYQGSLHGATGSRLITGNTQLAVALEAELGEYFQAEAALLFNSGYAANQGVLSALLQRGDTVLYDELSHACIKDGCRLSAASRYSFRHNDLDNLKQKLQKASGRIIVVVESVYSMDGDEAPLADLLQLCKEYGAGLIVDEAHSTGLWGPDGAGSCVALGLGSEVLARIHTFGKAMGVHGACVVGSATLAQYLLNFSRPFIYTTALPAHSLLAIREAVRYRQQHPELAEQLFRNVGLFHYALKDTSLLKERVLQGRGPIQGVVLPGNERVRTAARQLQEQGFAIWPILAPTVSAGEERLRICLHSYNSPEEIRRLVEALNQL